MELSRQMYLNPTTHTQAMTTWRVVGTQNILSNSLRILNMKFNFDQPVNYKCNVGVWGCVNRIRFLDLNGVEIDNFENVPQIMSLLLAMSDDETGKDITKPLYGTATTQTREIVPVFNINTVGIGSTTVTPDDISILEFLQVGDILTFRGTLNGAKITVVKTVVTITANNFTVDSQFDATYALIDGIVDGYRKQIGSSAELVDANMKQLRLVRCLDFLRKSTTLNNGFFLQVEWNTGVDWVTQEGATAPTTYNMDYPVLAFEVYSKPLPNPKNISYYTFKTNRVNVPAQVNGTQQLDLDMKGFKGLFIRRLLLVNCNQSPQATDANRNTNDFGNYASLAQFDENINFALDGKALMTYKGLFSSAQKSGYLNDLWGSVLGYLGCDRIVNYNVPHGSSGIGNRAYGCVEVDALINKEFVLNYKRSCLDAPRQKALTIHVVAEVLKQYDEEKGLLSYMLM